MGYEFICGIPMAIGAALAIVFGLFIALEWLQDWAEKLINKNRQVTVLPVNEAQAKDRLLPRY